LIDLQPFTAREALWLIRHELTQPVFDSEAAQRLDQIAAEGLDLSSPQNFELSDQLADRLAEAHGLLAQLQNVELPSPAQGLTLRSEIAGVLALPPDLEAMVERRIRLEKR
jgi:hypothetical protein